MEVKEDDNIVREFFEMIQDIVVVMFGAPTNIQFKANFVSWMHFIKFISDPKAKYQSENNHCNEGFEDVEITP